MACVSMNEGLMTVGGIRKGFSIEIISSLSSLIEPNNSQKIIDGELKPPLKSVWMLFEETGEWKEIGSMKMSSSSNIALRADNQIFVLSGRHNRADNPDQIITASRRGLRGFERLDWDGEKVTSKLLSLEEDYNDSPILLQVPVDFCPLV